MAARVRCCFGSRDSALVTAPTRNAAAAVDGVTLHSAFWIPFSDTPADQFDLEEDKEDVLRGRVRECRFVFVDNASQVDNHVLYVVDSRLRRVSGVIRNSEAVLC